MRLRGAEKSSVGHGEDRSPRPPTRHGWRTGHGRLCALALPSALVLSLPLYDAMMSPAPVPLPERAPAMSMTTSAPTPVTPVIINANSTVGPPRVRRDEASLRWDIKPLTAEQAHRLQHGLDDDGKPLHLQRLSFQAFLARARLPRPKPLQRALASKTLGNAKRPTRSPVAGQALASNENALPDIKPDGESSHVGLAAPKNR